MNSELLELAESIAVQAGEFALAQRRAGHTATHTKTNELDVVTQVDRDTEAMVLSMIQQARPHDSIMGEEGSNVQGTSGITWVVDPIDGTVNFLYDNGQWAVSLGIVEGDPHPGTWNQLAGVVFNPTAKEVFRATADGPAELNGREIRANLDTPLSHALVATGFAYERKKSEWQARALASVIPEIRDLRRMGAASLDLCSVASGRLDAYYEIGIKPWDYAAGSLIAARAGATLGGLAGAPYGEDMMLAAGGELFHQLEHVLMDYFGPDQPTWPHQ